MRGIKALNKYLFLVDKISKEYTSPSKRRSLWLELYEKNNIEGLKHDIGTAMSLIHPDFEDVSRKSRQGFKSSLSDNCELGKLINGAKCPNKAQERDHIFPISLGGITSDVNRADLCSSCNRGKSNTVIGYFPWDGKTPDWVLEEIWKTRRKLG